MKKSVSPLEVKLRKARQAKQTFRKVLLEAGECYGKVAAIEKDLLKQVEQAKKRGSADEQETEHTQQQEKPQLVLTL